MTTEKMRTGRHEFVISRCGYIEAEAYEIRFRPLNPKTGEPWQASHRVIDGANIEPQGWAGRPCAYSTLDLARAARDRQIAKMAKR